MAEQASQDGTSLEQSQAAWTTFVRLTKIVVAASVVTLILLAFATL